ncbi:hypothetical protein BD779DRAFT_1675667 [Infundibulicybe gibba]|nr:hypothetical protein BD779DRAFT_1675667 [Infundibulicybe gibba]
MSSGNLSVQLPDLVTISSAFELRANHRCKPASIASEQWLRDSVPLGSAEQSIVHSSKVGLLAALCFPICDTPQLRVAADFLSLLVFSNSRADQADDLAGCGWLDAPSDLGMGWTESFGNHALFQHIIPSIQRLHPTDLWCSNFAESVRSYRSAQAKIINMEMPSNLDVHVQLRREATGFRMVFDLMELVNDLKYPSAERECGEIRDSAGSIIAWTLDIVAYTARPYEAKYNLISFLVHNNKLSVQGAMNLAAVHIKSLFSKFAHAERSLLAPPPGPSLWNWWGSPARPLADETADNVRAYVQALRDCVAGTVHWVYETELYFGQKGEEVRSFGWIFLNYGKTLSWTPGTI